MCEYLIVTTVTIVTKLILMMISDFEIFLHTSLARLQTRTLVSLKCEFR